MNLIDDILRQMDGVRVVSIDIYDTLLYRLVRKPEQIFDKMYEMNPELFPEYIDAAEWREIRKKTEAFAYKEYRKEGREEIELSNIYDKLPAIIENRKEIQIIELECEKRYSYINPAMIEVIKKLKEKNIRIILVSDMYLKRKDICDILLSHGISQNLFENIFVSSEFRARKSTGHLFEHVFKTCHISPEELLHIGDNRNSDYKMPLCLGAKAVRYDVIGDARIRYPFFRVEEDIYGDGAEELYSLRIHAASLYEADDGEREDDRFWFELGAMQVAPLLTLAAEWVLDVAEKNGIRHIFPMMREGKFISKMLEAAKHDRGWNGTIELLYISREALYPALLPVIKEKDIQYNLTTHHNTLGKLLHLLRLDELLKEYEQYKEYTLEQLKYIDRNKDEGYSVYTVLTKRLLDEKTLAQIRRENENGDELLFDYLRQLGFDKDNYITVDIGWRGNSQNAIQRIMNRHEVKTKGLHLLFNGKVQMLMEQNLNDGCDIRGYTGNFGKNAKLLSEMLPYICETFLICDEGSTSGYDRQADRIVPRKKNAAYDRDQLHKIMKIQEGILTFQHEYYKLKREKGKVNCTSKDAVSLLVRLLREPTAMEAKKIGALSFDQNFGIDANWQIISQEKLTQYSQLGYTEFVRQQKAREDEWYAGMDQVIDPFGVYKKNFSRYVSRKKYMLLGILIHILEQADRKFVLVGAGKRCELILEYLNMAGLLDRVVCIIDNDEYLWGSSLGGKRIISPEDVPMEIKDFIITLGEKSKREELKEQLQNIYEKEIHIWSTDITAQKELTKEEDEKDAIVRVDDVCKI